MLDAGRHYLLQQKRSLGVSEDELVKIAIRSLGLNDVTPFDPHKKIIEWILRDEGDRPLAGMKLGPFAQLAAGT